MAPSIRDPDLIEIGTEVLNPIEVSAVGMGDTKKDEAEFGTG